MSENADPYSDPYADMTPAYGSADGGAIDFSVEAAMPPGPPPETETETETEPPAAESDPEKPASRPEPAVDDVPRPVVEPASTFADRPLSIADPTPSGARGGSGTFADPALPSVAERQAEALVELTKQVGELLRLRAADIDLVDRLYADNTRLRAGEFAAAVAPLLSGLLKLHDQMASLAHGDAASVAGMLRIQLLQILDTAAGLTPFEPRVGERFDSSRHAGAGRTVTTDLAAEGTVARTLKPGFERADGSIVRVAQVEVHRFESRQ